MRPRQKPNLLELLVFGSPDDEGARALAEKRLAGISDTIRAREDCADFRLAYLTRILFYERDNSPLLKLRLTDGQKEGLEALVLDFPFEDRGGHGMCTWTENHRLYFDGCLYLLTLLFPEEAFRDGSASECRERALMRLKDQLERILADGFCEWGSSNYYSETLAGLSNLFEFSEDEALRGLAEKALRLILYDILSRSFRLPDGGFVFDPACARAYADNKVSPAYAAYLEPFLKALCGEPLTEFKEKEGSFALMLQAKDREGRPLFRLPAVLRDLMERTEKETALAQGIPLRDYRRRGLLRYSEENARYAMAAGAVSNAPVICGNVRYLVKTGLIDNQMLRPLYSFRSPLLYGTGLLGLIKRFVPVVSDHLAMEEGRVYTYTNGRYSVSAAFSYRVGEMSVQQNPLAVALSRKVSLCVTRPYKPSEKTGSPDYWVGSAENPEAAAWKNRAFCVFGAKKPKGLPFTHLFFPTGLFDELDLSDLDQGLLLARADGVNLCVRTNPGVFFRDEEESARRDVSLYQDEKLPKDAFPGPYDLLNEAAGSHYYAFLADSEKTFADFCASARAERLRFDSRTKTLTLWAEDGQETAKDPAGGSAGKSFSLQYRGPFAVDGTEFKPRFERAEEILSRMKEDL